MSEPTLEQKVQIMWDKQQIYELLCRYCRGADRMDKELFLDCFWPGAIDIHVGAAGVYTGTVEEFIAGDFELWRRFSGSQHYIMNHLCEVDGDFAVAETYQMSAYWGVPGDDPALNFFNSNRYIDEFEKRDGIWKISHRELLKNFTRSQVSPHVFANDENMWPKSYQSREDHGYRTVASQRAMRGKA